jgi:CHASE2 domain-containing sensor protein
MVGAALAGAMVIMGVAATLFAIRYKIIPPFFPPAIFLVMNVIGILVFGALIAGGIALRRNLNGTSA